MTYQSAGSDSAAFFKAGLCYTYAFYGQTGAANTEIPLLLIRNTSTTKLQRIFDEIASSPKSPNISRTAFRIYMGPTVSTVLATAGRTLTFTNVGAADRITASSGSFVADGFRVGSAVTITGTASNNIVTGVIASVTATMLTFTATTSLVNEGPLSSVARITGYGTTLGVVGLRSGQPASAMAVTSMPSVSSNGTLVDAYGAINTPTSRLLNLSVGTEPGGSYLVTTDCSSAAEFIAFAQKWVEETL